MRSPAIPSTKFLLLLLLLEGKAKLAIITSVTTPAKPMETSEPKMVPQRPNRIASLSLSLIVVADDSRTDVTGKRGERSVLWFGEWWLLPKCGKNFGKIFVFNNCLFQKRCFFGLSIVSLGKVVAELVALGAAAIAALGRLSSVSMFCSCPNKAGGSESEERGARKQEPIFVLLAFREGSRGPRSRNLLNAEPSASKQETRLLPFHLFLLTSDYR